MSYGGKSKKWVVKTDETEEKPEKPEKPRKGGKGGKSNEGKSKAERPEEPEPTGPAYGQESMLRLFEIFKKKGIPDDLKLGYKTESRPEQAEAVETNPTAQREALREVLKNQKQLKRAASGTQDATPKAQTPKAQTTPTARAAMPPTFPFMPPPMAMPQVPPMGYICPLWGTEATVRLSNVPTGYKQETLAALLGVRFRGAIDFLFLPQAREGSGENVHNAGHAFLNFRFPQAKADFAAAFDNKRVSACFPGSKPADAEAGEEDKEKADPMCKVHKVKINTLDKLITEARQQASGGKPVRMPVLWDYYGNVRPLPTADGPGAAAAAAAAASAAAMSAAANSGNAYGAAIRQQIEYYFSFDNMCRDVFLRGKMDEEGWVPMSLIASFNKIKQYGVAADTLATYLQGSEVVEVDAENHRLRQLDAKQRVIWELKSAVDGQGSAAKEDSKGDEKKEASS